MEGAQVSIIVSAYNAEKFIRETLQSVYDQSYHNWEAIIVDDGSTDRTAEIAETFVTRDRRFRLFHQGNRGVSAARNAGFNFCSGSYIAFLDADDVWLEDNIESKVSLLKNSDYGLVHSDASLIDSNSNQMGGVIHGKQGYLLNSMLQWKDSSVPGPSSILLKREVVIRVGLFDVRLSTSADQDFFIRVAKDYSIGRVPKITWLYRLHAENMHRNIALMEKDVRLVYKNARDRSLFESFAFERECVANMFLILAANWAGEQNNYRLATKFTLAALVVDPRAIGNIFMRLRSKWKASS
jgi:glycosyltransferase involved in cell wall biosynthesis